MLKEQQTVPPTLEQCTIRDQIENTRGVSIILSYIRNNFTIFSKTKNSFKLLGQ